jgi:hypothetical protein
MRFTPTTVSALVYPHSPDEHDVALSTAESLGPWQSDEQTLAFQRLPTSINECRAALTALLASQGEIAPSVSFG